MDKTVYLVRHCQAAGQELHAELTEKGKEQAKELIHFFEKRIKLYFKVIADP